MSGKSVVVHMNASRIDLNTRQIALWALNLIKEQGTGDNKGKTFDNGN